MFYNAERVAQLRTASGECSDADRYQAVEFPAGEYDSGVRAYVPCLWCMVYYASTADEVWP